MRLFPASLWPMICLTVAASIATLTASGGQPAPPQVSFTTLTAFEPSPNSLFGQAVSIDGSIVAVGSPSEAVGANAGQGAVQVFHLDGSLDDRVLAPDGAALDQFGASLAVSGNTLIVGAPHRDGRRGAVYVFDRVGFLGIWWPESVLVPGDAAADDRFGLAVALQGDTLVVGAPGADVGGYGDRGAAYVFTRNNGVWTQQAKLDPGDGGPSDEFGASASLDAVSVVIGAPGHNAGQGAAYVFTGAAASWDLEGKLAATEAAPAAGLGRSVDISGDTVVVGAFAAPESGSAYIFGRSGSIWSQQDRFVPSRPGDQFGSAVGISGNAVVVGARNVSGYLISAAFTYFRRDAKFSLSGQFGTGNSSFGRSVAIANNAMVIGAPAGNGAAYVFSVFDPPFADSGVDQTVIGCQGCFSPVFLNGSGSSDPNDFPLQYSWAEGGVVLSTESANPISLSAMAFGAHSVDLTVRNSFGFFSTDTVVVNVQSGAGITGPEGPQGPQGPAGPQGAIGPAGVDGISIAATTELPGANCANGGQRLVPIYSNGSPAGPPSYVCNGVPGPAGPDGAVGPMGPTGPAGPAGPAGPQGPMGPEGLAGSSAAAVQSWNTFIPVLISPYTASALTPDQAITITRVQIQSALAPAGCSRHAIVRISDGTPEGTRMLTVSGLANDSGVVAWSYTAGTRITIGVSTGALCKVPPVSATAVVQYK